jgi:hypothetical protein
MAKYSEHELAEALESYINPDHPEFDLDFSVRIIELRPDWFTIDEVTKVESQLQRLWDIERATLDARDERTKEGKVYAKARSRYLGRQARLFVAKKKVSN